MDSATLSRAFNKGKEVKDHPVQIPTGKKMRVRGSKSQRKSETSLGEKVRAAVMNKLDCRSPFHHAFEFISYDGVIALWDEVVQEMGLGEADLGDIEAHKKYVSGTSHVCFALCEFFEFLFPGPEIPTTREESHPCHCQTIPDMLFWGENSGADQGACCVLLDRPRPLHVQGL